LIKYGLPESQIRAKLFSEIRQSCRIYKMEKRGMEIKRDVSEREVLMFPGSCPENMEQIDK
jgi:hypothetical protein